MLVIPIVRGPDDEVIHDGLEALLQRWINAEMDLRLTPASDVQTVINRAHAERLKQCRVELARVVLHHATSVARAARIERSN